MKTIEIIRKEKSFSSHSLILFPVKSVALVNPQPSLAPEKMVRHHPERVLPDPEEESEDPEVERLRRRTLCLLRLPFFDFFDLRLRCFLRFLRPFLLPLERPWSVSELEEVELEGDLGRFFPLLAIRGAGVPLFWFFRERSGATSIQNIRKLFAIFQEFGSNIHIRKSPKITKIPTSSYDNIAIPRLEYSRPVFL